jgi:predicted hydrocarbon binding protein
MIVYLSNPQRRLFHVVLELKNEVGAISVITSLMAGAKIKILSGVVSTTDGGSLGTWSFFADAKDSSLAASQVQQLLSSSRYVQSAVVNQSDNGLLIDKVQFPLQWNTGERAITMRLDTFSAILRKIRDIFGTGGEVILFQQGLEAGKFRFGVETVGKVGDDILRALVSVLPGYAAVGWGRAELMPNDSTDTVVTVRLWENFECQGRTSKGPYSQFVRGHLTGLFTGLMEGEVSCKERKCLSMGDEYCEFVISKPKSSGE